MSRYMSVIGTRPEIIKMAPLIKQLDSTSGGHILLHSGQHYDYEMDKLFFEQLNVREPDYHLDVKNQPTNDQVARIIQHAGDTMRAMGVTDVLVQGDTITTLSGAIAAALCGARVSHVEAGIRSFDPTMLEERNRVCTDHIADFLFPPTDIANKNLEKESIRAPRYVVGNTVCDALVENLDRAQRQSTILGDSGVDEEKFIIVTYHRKENADVPERLGGFMEGMARVHKETGLTVLFPIHPRTKKRAMEFGVFDKLKSIPGMKLIDPVGYFDMLVLQKSAALVMTDSGGLQEESCILKTPCVTLRDNTERPETIDIGSNMLAGPDAESIAKAAKMMLGKKAAWENPYGDGTTAKQIVSKLEEM